MQSFLIFLGIDITMREKQKSNTRILQARLGSGSGKNGDTGQKAGERYIVQKEMEIIIVI